MKLVLNIVFLLLTILLCYMLYASIREPIAFNEVFQSRKNAVVARLMEVREAQQAYKSITGVYAPNFDTLSQVLQTGTFKVVRISGEDENNLQVETTSVPAADSIKKIKMNLNGVEKVGIDLDSLRYVPFGDGATFEIGADTITYQGTPGLPVMEVKTPVKTFMKEYDSDQYKRYNANFNPDDPEHSRTYYVRFGDMAKPSTSGNWE